MFSLVGFIIATILRYMAHAKGPGDDGEQLLIAARIIYSADIVAFIVRLLQIFSVNRNLGPKLVMIKKMVSLEFSNSLQQQLCIYFNFVMKKDCHFISVGIKKSQFSHKYLVGCIYWSLIRNTMQNCQIRK